MAVTRDQDKWSYEMINHTSHPISVVSLFVEAPFKVTSSPVGWAVHADGCSTVDWISKDTEMPYPHDIQPGASLGGFTIRSAAKTSVNGKYVIQSWDETNGRGGKVFEGEILVPGVLEGNCAHD